MRTDSSAISLLSVLGFHLCATYALFTQENRCTDQAGQQAVEGDGERAGQAGGNAPADRQQDVLADGGHC